MPGTIVGLDIGAETIKAVAVVAKGRTGVRVRAAETVRLTPDTDPEAALKALAEKMAQTVSRVVISLPASDVMFRQITLPFRDDGRIRKTLPFEIEPLLPVPVDDVYLDYMKLSAGKLLVAAARRQHVKKWIQRVEAVLGPVSAVEVSGVLLHAASAPSGSANGPGIVLDVGESVTTAVFCDAGAIIELRSFAFGGQTITNALARDLDCDFDAAETVKQSGRYPQDSVEVRAACRSFCDQLQNTIEFMALSETMSKSPVYLTLTGGGALFLPLHKQLEETFGLTPDVLDVAGSGPLDIDPKAQASFQPQVFNTALAAAKRAWSTKRLLNFRAGDPAAARAGAGLQGQIRRLSVLGAVIVLLFTAGVYLDYHTQALQAARLKEQIRVLFVRHVGPGAVMVDPLRQMENKLSESQKSYGLQEGMSDVTVVDLLREISARVTPSVDLTLTSFYYENKVALLKGEARSMDDVTAVKNELANSAHFKEAALGATSMASDGSKVNFDLRLELR
ncbi:MAG: type II secretion system protein GspL [Smithellaceae bacterium]